MQTDNGSEFFGTAQGVQAQILSAYGLPSDLKVWDFSVDQQYGDPWQTGTHDGCLYFAGEIYTYPVEIIPNPVLSVEINDVYRTPDMAFEVTELYMNNGQTEYGTYDKYDIEPWVTVRTAEGSYEGLVRNVDQTLADRYYLTRRYPTQLGSNQSPVNPWVSGNVYSAHFNFWGSRYDYSVSIVDSLITDASADAPVFIYDLLESETVTETTDEGEVTWNRLIADCVPESVTVWTADGSRFSGEPEAVRWEIINKFGLNDQVVEFDYGTDQSYENQWTVGTHHAWFSLMGQTFAYDVTLIDNPVLSATAGDLQFSTADVGMRTEQVLVPDTDEWITVSYDWYPVDQVTLTVETDRGVVSGSIDQIADALREFYGLTRARDLIGIADPQSYDNVWTTGTYTASVILCGMTVPFSVTIGANPVTAVTVLEDPVFFLGVGDIREEWIGENNDEYVRWSRYNCVNLDLVRIETADGSFEGNVWEAGNWFYDNYGSYPDIWVEETEQQSYQNQWGLGDHDVVLHFNGVEAAYQAHIIENPVVSVTAQPLTVYEIFAELYTTTYYDDEGHEQAVSWYHHDLGCVIITVELADGSSRTGRPGVLTNWVLETYPVNSSAVLWDIYDDQSAENPWLEGSYSAEVFFFGRTAEFPVEVLPSPVASVEVTGPTYIVGSGDPVTTHIVTDDGEYWYDWMEYDMTPAVTVTLKDGETYSGNPWTVIHLVCEHVGGPEGVSYDIAPVGGHQYYGNQWDVGTHPCILYMFSQQYPYNVEIVANPVLSLTAPTVRTLEGLTRTETYWDSETHEYITFEIYDVALGEAEITLETTKGTFTGTARSVAEQFREAYDLPQNGPDYYIQTDQGTNNSWSAGMHEAELVIYGLPVGTVAVEIIACPVTALTADPVSCLEGTAELDYYDWQDDQGFWHQEPWYRYEVTPSNVTATAGGKEYKGNPYNVLRQICAAYGVEFQYGAGYAVTSDQSPDNTWEAGPHSAVLRLLSETCSYEVNVIANPVISVTVDPLVLMEGDTYLTYEYIPDPQTGEWVSLPYEAYRTMPEAARISIVTADREYSGLFYQVISNVTSDYGLSTGGNIWSLTNGQGYGREWGVGEHHETLTFLGVEADYPVTVIADPVTGLSVSDTSVMEGDTYFTENYDAQGGYMSYYEYRPNPDVTVTTALGTFTGKTGEVRSWLEEQYGLTRLDKIRVRTDQSADNVWTAEGSPYEASFLLGVHSSSFLVTIETSPVTEITVEPIVIFEGDTVPGDPVCYEIYNYIYDAQMHAVVNGQEYSGRVSEVLEQIIAALGLAGDYYEYLNLEQSDQYAHPWNIGTHPLPLTVFGYHTDAAVEIIPNPILSLEAEPFTVMSGQQTWVNSFIGSWNYTDSYMGYSLNPEKISVVTAGKTYEGQCHEVVQQLHEDYGVTNVPFYVMSDQSASNVWNPGEHTATIRFGGVEDDYTITVEENPIRSVSVSDFSVFESDYVDTIYYSEESGGPAHMRLYMVEPPVFSVETTKGTFEGNEEEFRDFYRENFGGEVFVYGESDQRPGQEWSAGNTYTCLFYVNGIFTEYHVTVIPDGGMTLQVQDLSIPEGETVTETYWTQEGPVTWELYDVMPRQVTVGIGGSVYSGDPGFVRAEIYHDLGINMNFWYDSDQTPDNTWGPGVHQAWCRFGGVEANYNVTVVPQESDTLTLMLSGGNEGIALNWNRVRGATKYTVYSVKGSKATKLGETADLTYTVTKDGKNELQMGTSYKFKVTATVPGVSSVSDTKSIRFNPFKDVPDDSASFDYIAWAYNNAIVKGSVEADGNRYFYPNGSTSRMNFVMILWKMHGSPVVKGKNPFKDVSGTKSVNAVKWAVKMELVKGTSATTFSPDADLSRINIVMILWKLAGSPSVKGSIPFTDVSGSKTVKAVKWAYKKGIIGGVDATHFDPDGQCSRALFVEVLCKYNEIYKILK